MSRLAPWFMLCCLLLTACGSSDVTSTPPGVEARLPTRLPTATPTATPFAVSAQAYYQQGLERQRLGDLARARQSFTWAIQRDPGLAPAYVARGALYLAQGELDGALHDAGAALQIQPTPAAYQLRGEILLRMARFAQALEAFDQALALDPALGDGLFAARWEAARALKEDAYLAQLAEAYAGAHPDDPLRHYYTAWVAFRAGQYERVVAMLVEAIQRAPRQPAVLWYLLGRAYTGIEARQEAIVSLETASRLVAGGDATMLAHSEHPAGEVLVTLGRAYLAAGRCADAETMLARGLSLGAPMAEHLAALEAARACQTATPSP